ncbi:hypothetical protein FALBO_9496 [Fusarium albosuccineum]|uniref:Uncharacterized protein n=1 Tax=Fusarium albosuccineum TaxID=1237068 RepID=A0A8H4PJ00_9HYPO|nr:hypothetical protein FALBO_9496 [Fusarium albosuccineum]
MSPYPSLKSKPSKWAYFRRDLRTNDYPLGDAYQDGKRDRVLQELKDKGSHWSTLSDTPYLAYVKRLATTWPELQLLADFMEIGTVPMRWCIFPGEQEPPRGVRRRYTYLDDTGEVSAQQARRSKSLNVALLQYDDTGKFSGLQRFKTPSNEANIMEEKRFREAAAAAKSDQAGFKLFVVEDLSRLVIETLGSELNVDPRFFRAHVVDYAWNNIRDPWREHPSLNVVSRAQNWFQARLVRARYFPNPSSLEEAQSEVNKFNIFRRLDPDENQSFWDRDPDSQSLSFRRSGTSSSIGEKYLKVEQNKAQVDHSSKTQGEDEQIASSSKEDPVDAKVGLIRSRATFWLQTHRNGSGVGEIATYSLSQSGYPLWRGYSNWESPPPFAPEPDDIPEGPPSMSTVNNNPKTWFEDFLYWAGKDGCFPIPSSVEEQSPMAVPVQALLHLICAEWLTFADYLNARLNQIDWEISRPAYFSNTGDREPTLDKLNIWRRWVPQCRDVLAKTLDQVFQFHWNQKRIRPEDVSPIVAPYKRDYKLIIDRLAEYQSRIDRLSTVVNSAISLEDARNTAKNSKNLGNLTVLASIFIPPSFFATFLSMNDGPISQIRESAKWWGVMSVVALSLLMILFSVMSKGPKEFYEQAIRALGIALTWLGNLFHVEKCEDTHKPDKGNQNKRSKARRQKGLENVDPEAGVGESQQSRGTQTLFNGFFGQARN